jgi:hypothetical protein
MPVTISGDGTITGVVAGGLPDGVITASELASGQTGSAPTYAARAWVNFSGATPPTLTGAGNVSSVTRNATGNFTINITTAMPDTAYAVVTTPYGRNLGAGSQRRFFNVTDVDSVGVVVARTTTTFTVNTCDETGTQQDPLGMQVIVYR